MNEKVEVGLHVRVADCFLSALVIGPAVVCYWRGTWNLLDLYLFPNDTEKTGWISAAIGIFIPLIFSFCQFFIQKLVEGESKAVFVLMSRVYTYFFAFGCVSQWRGVWYLLDHYTGTTPWGAAGPLIVACGVMVFVRGLVNTLAPPLVISMDFPENYFTVTRRFNIQPKDLGNFIYDAVFSVVIIDGLVVCIWRGTWLLLDFGWETVIAKDVYFLSHISSLCLGYGLTFLAMLFQHPVHLISQKLLNYPKVFKIAIEDIFTAAGIVGCVSVWHGVWYILDAYFLPDRLELSAWISHIMGFCVTLALFASNSLLVRGCSVDGDSIEDVHYLVQPVQYFESIKACRKEKTETPNVELRTYRSKDEEKKGGLDSVALALA
ncbi:uncharacterized protein LOC106152997 [Lingula anatina]|uniref:Uncharacterized protein LOC106152997 n=1 Tax=Lingula anatina TaxID=7574 RepID=A0A1S3H9R1_LINAN|nr:uncharacterized protein LOC106152997 [Lingula anatina]|eukprot:XP_013382206.1 uncharacterized protein LOC106152997 [Lingula anatina]